MTTRLKIDAAVTADKEVRVTVLDKDTLAEAYALQNGESKEIYIWDERAVHIKECKKDEA